MITTYKYPIKLQPHPVITIPEGAKLLKTMVQDERLCAWFVVDTTAALVDVYLMIITTGETLDGINFDAWEYVDSFMLDNGSFVGHLYREV